MYDINMIGGGHPALPPAPHHPHHPHVIPHPHSHMLPHPGQQQHPHPHAHPLQHQMPHNAAAGRVANRHHFDSHRGTGTNSIIPPPGSNGSNHGLGLTTTSSGNSGITTFYRTLSADNKPTTVVIGPNGEPIKLPESLESLPKSDHFPTQRHRWNTNEEIASMLIAFERHNEWLSKEVKIRPKSGSTLLYSRKKVRYRRDGYCWKKRKDGKTTREDHMKLKVQGIECIYGCYVHSAILPTFHRRCYWLLQNPDVVLVHYLNVPYPDDNKMLIANSVNLWAEKKEWTKEELICQLKPMWSGEVWYRQDTKRGSNSHSSLKRSPQTPPMKFFSEEEPDLNNELEISTAETVEAIVTQLMEKQRNARQAALNKQLECGCPETNATNGDKMQCCIHNTTTTAAVSTVRNSQHKVQATKSEAHTTTGRSRSSKQNQRMLRLMQENNNQVILSANKRSTFYGSSSSVSLGSPSFSSSSPQVTSTTGHLGIPGSMANQELHHHQQQQQQHHHLHHNQSPPNHPYMHHHQQQHHGQVNQPSLVLSLSQIQSGGGLLILNGNGGNGMNAGGGVPPNNVEGQVHRTDVNNHLNRLTPLTMPPATAVTPLSCNTEGSTGSTTSTSGNLTLMHSNRSDTMESSGSSNSPLDSIGGGNGGLGATSPVASAVRSLTSLSDFSLLEGGTSSGSGNFDAYSGLQPITDSLLSGVGNGNGSGEDLLSSGNGIRKSENHSAYNSKSSSINTSATTSTHNQFGGGHLGRTSTSNSGVTNNNNNNISGGPLLDFKSAFSVLDDKPGSLSFLHENAFETQSDEMHRSMMGGGNKNQSNIHHRNTTHNQGHVQPQQHHQSPMLHQHPAQQPLHHPASSAFGSHPADLNPMDFIEQDIIQGGGHHQTPGMISNNAQHNMHQANSGGLVGSNFDVNLDAPFDMMSAFPDLDPNQFNAAGGGAENQHSPLIHQNNPGPMLGSSPMNSMIKNENGMGSNNRSHTGHHTNTQQQRSQQQQSHNNHMQHLNNQNHQHHSHGHPHISDYSPEWGWTDGGGKLLVILSWDKNTASNEDLSTRNCDGIEKGLTSTIDPSNVSHYEILFNGVGVPTTEIHPGVLRCLIPEHDSGMVQLQVACYKKNVLEGIETSRQLDSENRDECDIISELLFHNDGANDIHKRQTSQNTILGSVRPAQEVNQMQESGKEEIMKSNIVMFEFRDQISNLNDQDVGPFASFFDNDCDFLEEENKKSHRNINANESLSTTLSNICATSKCSNDYLCRTDACKKHLQIELLEKIEHYSNLAPPSSLHSSCEKERQQIFSQEQHHFEESKNENPSHDKNNDKGQKHVVTNCFEEYLMSVFKDIINRCNEIILQEGSNNNDGGHNIQHQRIEKCDHNTFYHCNSEPTGLYVNSFSRENRDRNYDVADSRKHQNSSAKFTGSIQSSSIENELESTVSSKMEPKFEDSNLKIIHMAAVLGLTRFCRLLYEFHSLPFSYEMTTDDKNGLLSSSWLHPSNESETKQRLISSNELSNEITGCNKEEIAPDMRLESSHGATGSSLSLTCHLKNQNHINLAKDTLSRLKEESYILSQDRLGFTPLMRACQVEHVDTISFLCEKGSTALRIKNSKGQTCMDLASQSHNPLIANLLEKKYLETSSSSDEFQVGGRKRNIYNNNSKIIENIPCVSASFRNKPSLNNKQEKLLMMTPNEIEGTSICKQHCPTEKLYSGSHHWRAKSLDDQERSYSSSNLHPNLAKQGFPHSISNQKPTLKELQKPLTIHIDCPFSSPLSSSKILLRSSSSTCTTAQTGCRETASSLHVPCGTATKSQRRLSKRSSFDSGIYMSSCHQRQHSSPHMQTISVSKGMHNLSSVFQHGTSKATKTSIEDDMKSKMNRASSLPSTNKTHHQQSSSSLSSHRPNAPTQAEVVKSRILKTETENQMMQENLRNNGGYMNQLKVENDDENPESPFVDVEALSDGDEKIECDTAVKSEPEPLEGQRVLNLAEQFIAAMPARIKNEGEGDAPMLDISNQNSGNNYGTNSNLGSTCSPLICDTSQSDDLGIESMGDDLDFEFDLIQDVEDSVVSGRFGYREVLGTPSESAFSVSPSNSSFLHSPSRSSFTIESPSPCGTSFSVDTDPSPQGTTQDLQEFLQASLKCERDLSYLTLSDQEQRELYEAAQIIQKAYRSYKGRSTKGKGTGKGSSNGGTTNSNQDSEARAAVLIQNYYRRYKQYLYWKQMANAATVIQNKYRTYCENKRFKKSKDAAMCIQSYYRTYKEHQTGRSSVRSSRESTPSTSAGVKRTYSQRRQNQAAKKIQQFMKKTHLKPINEITYLRKGASERAGCFTCRKREASPAIGGPGVPAKLPTGANSASGATGNNSNFSASNNSNNSSTSANSNNATTTSAGVISNNNVVTHAPDGRSKQFNSTNGIAGSGRNGGSNLQSPREQPNNNRNATGNPDDGRSGYATSHGQQQHHTGGNTGTTGCNGFVGGSGGDSEPSSNNNQPHQPLQPQQQQQQSHFYGWTNMSTTTTGTDGGPCSTAAQSSTANTSIVCQSPSSSNISPRNSENHEKRSAAIVASESRASNHNIADQPLPRKEDRNTPISAQSTSATSN